MTSPTVTRTDEQIQQDVVDRDYQKADAERAVSRLTGVQGVITQLTVRPPVPQSVGQSTAARPDDHLATEFVAAEEARDLKFILLTLIIWGSIFGALLVATALSASSAR